MKQLPQFVKSFNLVENNGVYELTIVLHYKENNKPYNRLSHLIIKDWAGQKLGGKIDSVTFDGPSAISNKTGANIGLWTFKLLEEQPKQTKTKKTKKVTKKEEKDLDIYEEMTYPLPSKD